jgi:hypothetical protein
MITDEAQIHHGGAAADDGDCRDDRNDDADDDAGVGAAVIVTVVTIRCVRGLAGLRRLFGFAV